MRAKIFAFIIVFGLFLAAASINVEAQDSDDECVYTCNIESAKKSDYQREYEGCRIEISEKGKRLPLPKGRCEDKYGFMVPDAPFVSSRDGNRQDAIDDKKPNDCDRIRIIMEPVEVDLRDKLEKIKSHMAPFLDKGKEMASKLDSLESTDSDSFNRLRQQTSFVKEAFETGDNEVDSLISGIVDLDRERSVLWKQIESIQDEYIILDKKLIDIKIKLAECEKKGDGTRLVEIDENGITIYSENGDKTTKTYLDHNSVKAHPGNPNTNSFVEVVNSVNQIIRERGVKQAKEYLETIDNNFRDNEGKYNINPDALSFSSLKDVFFESLIRHVSEAKKSIDGGSGLNEVLESFRKGSRFYDESELSIRKSAESEIEAYYNSVVGGSQETSQISDRAPMMVPSGPPVSR